MYSSVGPFAAGVHPNALAIASFDQDPDLDLAVPGLLGDDLVVIENRGGGAFSARPARPLPGGPLALAAADLDEDGHIDLIASLPGAGAVRVLLGDGALGFRDGAEHPIEQPGWLATGDVDGDGHVDVVVARFEPGELRVLLGNGAGGLTLAETLPGAGGMSFVLLHDLDADGDLDLAATAANADRLLTFANDQGTFAPGPSSPTGRWPSWIAAAQLDGDPELELLVPANLGDTLLVAELPSTLVAGVPLATREIATAPGPIAVAAADLDGDGDVDVVTTNKFANTVTLYENDGGGGLTPRLDLPAPDGPTPVEIADLDGAGAPDLAIVNGFSNDVVLYLAR